MCDIVIFFFNDTATTEIYTLSLHDALPILFGDAFESLRDHVFAHAIETINAISALVGIETSEIGRAHV